MNCLNRVLALEENADSPGCRPEVREAILRQRKSRHYQMKGLLRVLKITPEERAKRNGGRKGGREAFMTRRGSFVMTKDGPQDLEAGDFWLFDDMSQNTPFWFPKIDAEDDEDAARKQQVGLFALLESSARIKYLVACAILMKQLLEVCA